MNRAWKFVLLGALALVFAVALQEGTATACTYRCVEVPGPQPFCQRCKDLGFFTNETCMNSGDCACLDTGNNCFLLAAVSSTEVLKAAIFGPEPKAISTASVAAQPAAAQN
jgi:hypothetical protein